MMSEKCHPHLLILLIDLKHNFLLLLGHFHQHMTIHSSHFQSGLSEGHWWLFLELSAAFGVAGHFFLPSWIFVTHLVLS